MLLVDVDRFDLPASLEGSAKQFRALKREDLLLPTGPPRGEDLPKSLNLGVPRAERLAQEAAASDPSASLATDTSAVNACGSLTARSAKTLRSTSTPAAWRPAMKRL